MDKHPFITKQEAGGWDLLAAAVIAQAIDDYRRAYKVNDCHTIRSIEHFLRGKYFQNISNINPEMLISKLREKCFQEKDRKKRHYTNNSWREQDAQRRSEP